MNIKLLTRIMLLGLAIGILAIVLPSISRREVSADNYTPQQKDHENVTLQCSGFTTFNCNGYTRILANGTSEPFPMVPAGFILVVTDFEWESSGVPAGTYGEGNLYDPTKAYRLLYSDALGDSSGVVFSSIQATTGVEMTYLPVAGINYTPVRVTIRGYLVRQ